MSDTNASILMPVRDGATLETPPAGYIRLFFSNLTSFFSTKDSTGAIRSYQFSTPPSARESSLAVDSIADGETVVCKRAGIQTINLPSAAIANQRVRLKSTTANEITIQPSGVETIFTYQVETNLIINAIGASIELLSIGGNWQVIG